MPARVAALALDFLIVSVLQGIINAVFGTLHVTSGAIDPMVTGGITTYTTETTVEGPWLLLTWLAYFTILEGLFGATVGKARMHLRVARQDRHRAGWRAVIGRNLLRPIDAFRSFYLVGFLVATRSPLHQRLGDRAAGTIVIHASQLADPPLTRSQRWHRAGIVAALLALFAVVCLAFSYFGRPAIAATEAMRRTVVATEPVGTFHFGAGRRSASTVTYPVTFMLARSGRTCEGELTLHWEGFIGSWKMSGAQYECHP